VYKEVAIMSVAWGGVFGLSIIKHVTLQKNCCSWLPVWPSRVYFVCAHACMHVSHTHTYTRTRACVCLFIYLCVYYFC
jgi:hypothetical protein